MSQPQTSAIQPLREATGYPPLTVAAGGLGSNRIDGWHPKITPYRLVVTSLTIGLGTAKAVTSTSSGGSSASVTIEWITGVVILLATFFLTRHETKDEAGPYWLFRSDIVDRIRILGVPIPLYDTEERPLERLIKPGRPPITGYRILVSLAAISFGMTKALLAYRGLGSAPTTVEWVYGVLITVTLYWLGMYEASSTEVMPWLFVTDYSKQVYATVFAVGFVIVHLAALYAAQWWTRQWYGGVTDMISGSWASEPDTSALDTFLNRLFMLMWLVMAIGMGVGLGVVGICAVLASLGTVLIPVLIGLARASLRVAKRLTGRTRDGPADDEETLVDVSESNRTNSWPQYLRWPSIRFPTVQSETWKTVLSACEPFPITSVNLETLRKYNPVTVSYIAIAILYVLAHGVAFIIAFGWTMLWFSGLKAFWRQGNDSIFLWVFTIIWSAGACVAMVVGSCGTIAVVISFFSLALIRR